MVVSAPRLIVFILLVGSLAVKADETISLADYLSLANRSGLKIIFSTDLVTPRYRITHDPDSNITIEKIRGALEVFGLVLKSAAADSWVVVRRSEPDLTGAPEMDDFDANTGIEELVVTSSRHRLLMRSDLRSTLLDHEALAQRPAIGNDAFRLVEQLPGNSTVGVSARPRVRGGKQDETLILFDGVRLYEPFHFNSFNDLLSSFDSRVIDTIDFYSGGFPVSLGDRLSAAMLIEPRDASPDLHEAGIGIYNVSYLQTGSSPHRDWIVDARASNLQLLTNIAETDLGSPSFADLYGRLQWETAAGNPISVNVLLYGDDMDINNPSKTETSSTVYGNAYLWLKREDDWTDDLSVESWFGLASVNNNRHGVVAKPGQVSGMLADNREFRIYNIKQDFDYLRSSRLLFEFGWDYRRVTVDYRFDSLLDIDPAFAQLANFTRPTALNLNRGEDGSQFAAYGNIRTRLTGTVTAETGLRFDSQHYGKGFHDSQVSPRLNLLLEPFDLTQIRLGWGVFTQADGIHELKISDGVDRFQPAQRSVHTILGVRREFEDGTSIRLEAYRKRGLDPVTYFENLTNPLSLVPELQPDRIVVQSESFIAEGLELSLAGSFDSLQWWANYSYASVEDRTAGGFVKRSWDQRHAANIGFGTMVRSWHLSTNIAYHSGWSTTPLDYDGTTITSASRNSRRFGNFVSVDVKATREWKVDHNVLRLEAGMTNLLNRENVIGFEYNLDNGALTSKPKYSIPLAPILDLYYRF